MFEFAGGSLGFLALTTAFHRRYLEDPVLAHPFSHPGTPHHIERLADYWAKVLGGPPRYSESFGLRFPCLSHIHPVRPPASAITAL
jgi:hemoglobin